ncbi:DUF397 domain-containing protein [Streptomyces sp. F001]|uniref:DUF397 domain-containing protein n=1 Tax=Streptomyces sp. F001 TaxID=1510026 RepID=UPI00101E4482|nr:DUF397 domain-containing protein [Streptomyces sp. F001]RZB17137.1 DUF397 domain-containing protein [Streptomyces sp. F001]
MSIAEPSSSSRPTWFTSSYSNGAGGECVECGLMEHGAVLRDSKLSGGPEVTVGSRAWRSFVAALAQGHPAL